MALGVGVGVGVADGFVGAAVVGEGATLAPDEDEQADRVEADSANKPASETANKDPLNVIVLAQAAILRSITQPRRAARKHLPLHAHAYRARSSPRRQREAAAQIHAPGPVCWPSRHCPAWD